MTALNAGSVVAILGSGTMGRGVARVAAGAGHRVILFDVDADALESASHEVQRFLARDVEKSRLTEAESDAIRDRIETTATLATITEAALVIEAIVEDLEAKVALLRQVENHVGDEAIIATNTSSLSVTAIAARLERPERVAGMHFFNPAPVMPLIEVVAGADTAAEVIETLAATANAWGKTPVKTTSTPGFIVNRVARPFYGEALRIVEEAIASPPEVDDLMVGAGGFRMGPFALMDLVGLDVNLAVSKSVYEQTFHDPRFAPNQIQQHLVDAGRLGRKTGRGFYDYEDPSDSPKPRVVEPSEKVTSVIVHGDRNLTAGLVDRLRAAGVNVAPGFGPAAGVAVGTTLLWPSNGKPASAVDELVPELTFVALDDCLDWSTATRVAIAGGGEESQGEAAAVLAAAGIEARKVGDAPGLVVLRVMCQLASVAADALLKGVASAKDIDTAMRLGTNYPIGPLEWVDMVSAGRVVGVLDNIAGYYGEPRYRPSPLLRRAADLGTKFVAAS